jgi:hypothetical protein
MALGFVMGFDEWIAKWARNALNSSIITIRYTNPLALNTIGRRAFAMGTENLLGLDRLACALCHGGQFIFGDLGIYCHGGLAAELTLLYNGELYNGDLGLHQRYQGF